MSHRPDLTAPAGGGVLHATADPAEPALDRPSQELIRQVTDVFPDVCLAYVGKLAREQFCVAELVIQAIAGVLENGESYPKRSSLGKRKRQGDPISEITSKPAGEFDESDATRLTEYFEGPIWKAHVAKNEGYRDVCVEFLMSQVPGRKTKKESTRLSKVLRTSSLFKVYGESIAKRGYAEESGGQKDPRRDWHGAQHDDSTEKSTAEMNFANLHKEIHAARRIAAYKRHRDLENKKEAENREMAEANGSLRDCGCCFSDEPMNRMVSCDIDPSHLFCYPCARKNAEAQLGLSKYQLRCMSMDDCPGHFHPSDRKLYLDKKVTSALDRLEQNAALQAANIENLTSCPFCPYAAECPPVEEDKELRCENPDCGVVSCRLCSKETHVPKTCEEAAADNKASARHLIEEAMSAAMIRKCNKCATPFVKVSGCNKMTCTKPGCGNTQCYVCGMSCDYDHFRRSGQGGGGCTLEHDADVDERHRREAEAAQEIARKRVMEENPDIDEAELRIELPKTNVTASSAKARVRRAVAAPRAPDLLAPGPPVIRECHAVQGPQAVPVPHRVRTPGQAGARGQGQQFQFGRGQQFRFGQAQQLGQPFAQQGQQFSLAQAGLPPNGDAALWGATRQPNQQRPAAQIEIMLSNYQVQGAVSPAPYLEHYYAKNGGSIPGDRPAQVAALRNETMRNWSQRTTEARARIQQALEKALRPYIANMTQQVYQHVCETRAGPVPLGAIDPLLRQVAEEFSRGAATLAGRELEEIDMKVKGIPGNGLFEAPGVLLRLEDQGGAQSGNWLNGRIPAPETAGEYIAIHQMLRSQDVRAPPHHEQLARYVHGRVMATLKKQQQPPRIAPYHCYGNPSHPRKGQPSLAARMRLYLAMRCTRVGVQAQPDAQMRRESNNMPQVIDLVTHENTEVERIPVPQAASAFGTPAPFNHGTWTTGLDRVTSLPRPWGGVNNQAKTHISGGRVAGSKDAPILIDDADAGGSEVGLRRPNPLSFNGLLHAAKQQGGMQGNGNDAEPPAKRCKI